ncbi:DUF3267 domain-containing protein [Chloroflexota bacterium]
MSDNIITKKAYTVSMLRANIFVILWLPPVLLIIVLPYLLIWGTSSLSRLLEPTQEGLGALLALLLGGTIVRELLHGLTWQIAGKLPRKAIKYSIHWKTLTPYAHCKIPIEIQTYRLGDAMPGLILGLLPAVLALLTGSGWLLAFGVIFTWGAGGDLLIIWLLRNVQPGALIEDHPSEAGCYVVLRE